MLLIRSLFWEPGPEPDEQPDGHPGIMLSWHEGTVEEGPTVNVVALTYDAAVAWLMDRYDPLMDENEAEIIMAEAEVL